MKGRPRILGYLTLVSLLSLGLHHGAAQTLETPPPAERSARGQLLKRDLQDSKVAEHWHYDDWESAKIAAEKANKPIFVVFR